MPSQVTKALTQVPATDAAGPLLPSPSPFLGCWAGSVPQAMLSCPSFFTKGLLQEGQFVPKHQQGLLCHFGAPTAEDRLCHLSGRAISPRPFPYLRHVLPPGHAMEEQYFSLASYASQRACLSHRAPIFIYEALCWLDWQFSAEW